MEEQLPLPQGCGMLQAILRDHLVRVGVLGHVGRFVSVDAIAYPRGTRVICRTARGLELGEVLAQVPANGQRGASDGSLLRGVTAEDELLIARLQKNRQEAFEACRRLLDDQGATATLMDVEHLFDGQSLYFYFLGQLTPQLEILVDAMAERYEANVRFRDFAAAVETGCGPGCGTDAAAGCGEGGCETCSLAGGCKL